MTDACAPPHGGAPAPAVPVVVAVVGATASGKTGLSLDLAQRCGGEVVNTDAMQVYRGMDVGTAKLPPDQRRGIAHHLLDVLDIGESASVAQFQGLARAVIAEVRDRGRTPVLVGGSPLYTRAVLDRFDFPGTDDGVRRGLEQDLEAHGVEAMRERLHAVDPPAAASIGDNGRRLVRALEVVALTGRPWTASLPHPVYVDARTVQVGVDIDRPTLDRRIEQRVAQMFDGGLLEEVARLLDLGLATAPTASRAIGYREAVAVLAGELDEAEARVRVAAATRRFARRQDGWFRKDPRVVWVHHDDPDRVDRALHAVAEAGRGPSTS